MDNLGRRWLRQVAADGKRLRTRLALLFTFLITAIWKLLEHHILTAADDWLSVRLEGSMGNFKTCLLWIIQTPIIWPVVVVCFILLHAWVETMRRSRLVLCEHESVQLPPVSLPRQEPQINTGPARIKHNVQFVGFRRIQIDSDFPDLALATLCFENALIPEKPVADFHFARLQVNYSDFSTGEALADVFLSRWHDSPDAPIDICAGRKQCAIIASSIGSKWATDSLIDTPINLALEYGFGGSEYRHESVPLPLGRIKVKATLIGTHNLSIPPIKGILTLGEDGAASFMQDFL